jgi:hypothetical protein
VFRQLRSQPNEFVMTEETLTNIVLGKFWNPWHCRHHSWFGIKARFEIPSQQRQFPVDRRVRYPIASTRGNVSG